jgi:intein/homing endonuclease
MKYGCVPDKTHKGKLNIKILSNLPRDLKIAFLRGYLDGDGCFHYKYGFVNISIYRKEIAEQIQQLIFDTFKMKTGLIFTENKHFLDNKRIDSKQGEKNGSYSVLIYRRDDAKEFLREIYSNANIYLDAKYQKYLALEKLLKEKN